MLEMIYLFFIDPMFVLKLRLWEGDLSQTPTKELFALGMGQEDRCHPHEFAQSHIGERHLPLMPYKPLA